MNKKFLSLRLIIFVSLVSTVVAGLYLHNVNNTLNKSGQCILTDNACSFRTEFGDLTINFLQTPIIEEELFINFEISQEKQIKSAWIEGVNMYMGRTPVIFEEQISIKKVRGVTFLGSCSDPDMQWQLFIEVKNKAEQTEIYSALFTTKVK